jgi:hypothetical protein
MKYSYKRYRYKQNPTAFHADMYPQIPNYSNVIAERQGRMCHENATSFSLRTLRKVLHARMIPSAAHGEAG